MYILVLAPTQNLCDIPVNPALSVTGKIIYGEKRTMTCIWKWDEYQYTDIDILSQYECNNYEKALKLKHT